MARTVRDTNLGSRAARLKLKAQGKPYWRALDQGLHIGYRRLSGSSGSWVARRYAGHQTYQTRGVGTADDHSDSNHVDILNFAEAQSAARAWRDECSQAGAGYAGPLTVAQALEEHLSFLENHRKTARDARYMYGAFIRDQLNGIEVAALTAEKIRHWHANLAKEGARLRTKKGQQQRHAPIKDEDAKRRRRLSANQTLTLLKAALNRAFRAGKVSSDREWKLVEPFKKVHKPADRYLEIAEAKRLINAADPDFRLLVQGALETGARYSELARLTASDFKTVEHKQENGRSVQVGMLHIRESKSGKSRHIMLTDEGKNFFAQLCIGRTGLLFTKADGTAWGRSHQERRMRETVKRAHIAPIGFHGLRHTWASQATMNGVPLLVVAKNLGHTDTRMVEHTYGHLAPSYMADAIRAGAPKFGFKPDRKVVGLAR